MPNQTKLIGIVLLATLGLTALAQEGFNPARDGFNIETKSRNGKGVEVINGVPQNVDLANLRRQAESGDSKAQTDLAICLYDGKHRVPADNIGAYKWATVAASQGRKEAKSLVREMQIMLSENDLLQGRAAAESYLKNQKRTER
jgi:TPR repeat protein